MENPLLDFAHLPDFAAIRPEHVLPALEHQLAANRAALQALLDDPPVSDDPWQRLAGPIEAMHDRLERLWSPVGHLNSVLDSTALREAYNAGLPLLSAYYSEFGQNAQVYRQLESLAEGPDFEQLTAAQRKVVRDSLRDFQLSGVALPEAQQARFRQISQRLAQLGSRFQEQVLDATQAWSRLVSDASELDGLPESALQLLRQNAEREGKAGWLLNLEFPSYQPVMNYARCRALRRELYHAYSTRASDQGPQAGRWDNGPLMAEILQLRHEMAQLLSKSNYAEVSLVAKMAESPAQVEAFLLDLAQRSRVHAERELEQLRELARELDGIEALEAWDIGYYTELLRQQHYQLSQEDLRPYFPAPRVLNGMFQVCERLFGMRCEPADVVAWHEEVESYRIIDADGQERGLFMVDLYARPGKRGGAWMNGAVTRRVSQDELQQPVAYLVCNFTPPVGGQPALLTHREVETLFHEFGHALHHLLTQQVFAGVSGINGVEWDAVELPSQFLENWCWEREALDLFASHHLTHEPLPEALYERMRRSRQFQAALMMLRQIEFAVLDLRLHGDGAGHTTVERVLETVDAVRNEVALVHPPAWNRFANSFMHIFSGGYAAGYYSYKWAEVLSADAFGRFREEGIFDADCGADFLHSILEVGGSRPAMESFVAFRGREPAVDALLELSGLAFMSNE